MSHRRCSADEGFARTWAAFARHDGAQVVPPGLDARVRRSVTARRGVAIPAVVRAQPLAKVRVVFAMAACLVAAVTAGWLSVAGRVPSIAPRLPDGPTAERALSVVALPLPAALDVPVRPVAARAAAVRLEAAQGPRPRPAPLVPTILADGPLQVIRVRIAASALDALGVAVAGPIATGLVDVDVVVSADGWPMEVRRIRPVTVDGPVH